MLIEVIQKVRNRVGPDFPILMKMNSRDHLEGGLSLEDALTAGGLLEKEGLDALEISGGTFLSGELSPSRAGIKGEEKEAYFREAARAFKQRMNLPIILVGGIRSYSTADRLCLLEPGPDSGTGPDPTLGIGGSTAGLLPVGQPVF
jgi:2,4-dienoyl-CoA reductase-like NADH-dependent reductase (Old Yellow Enzyme family)